MKNLVLTLVLLSGVQAFAQFGGGTGEWTVKRLEWTDQDEQNYGQFIQAIGRTKCSTVDECIRSEANPYRDTDPVDVKFRSDCAEFPYFLRAYFAWKNNLPFSYVSGVYSNDIEDRKKNPPVLAPGEVLKPVDNRYSALGNIPTSRYLIMPDSSRDIDFFTENTRMLASVNSATFRMAPDKEYKIDQDFYSPDLRLGAIRPGTNIYDPNGHVAIVYDVLPDGRILHFDAHPDNSVTHGIYSSKFSRSNPVQGAGFRNFRPLKVVNASSSLFGYSYYNGKATFPKNAQIPDYSVAQYYGVQPNLTNWKQGTFVRNGKSLTFYEYLRLTLATEKINPVAEFQGGLQELCGALIERAQSVNAAVDRRIYQQAHPANLPANLFGSSGDWEDYATPGRDTRLKTTFFELQKNATERYNLWLNNDFTDMKYQGDDLKKDLLRAFHATNLECALSYTNSRGSKVQLGFELAMKRLFLMSFDPYHCPEMRWGATSPAELKTCQDDADKIRWYNAEQGIRNYLQRDWSASSEITADQLEAGKYGTSKTQTVDIRAFLQALPSKGGAR